MTYLGWWESSEITEYQVDELTLNASTIYFIPVWLADIDADPDSQIGITKVRVHIKSRGTTPYNIKLALYSQAYNQSLLYPSALIEDLGEHAVADGSYLEVSLAAPLITQIGTVIWIGVRGGTSQTMWLAPTPPGGAQETRYRYTGGAPYANAWPSTLISDSTDPVLDGLYGAIYSGYNWLTIPDTGHGADSPSIRASVSRSDSGGGADVLGSPAVALARADTGQGVDAISLVSQLIQVAETRGVAEALAVAINTIGIADTAAAIDSVLKAGTGNFISDLAHGLDEISISVLLAMADTINTSESFYAPLVTVQDYGGVSVEDGQEGEVVVAPIIVIADTGSGVDAINTVQALGDSGAAVDTVSTSQDVIALSDSGAAVDVVQISGRVLPDPPPATVGSLEARHVLKLILGDKRSPVRELDLAQAGDGNIYLRRDGHTIGSGEPNVLWSGQSIRFDGEKKIAESRGNSRISFAYDLRAGSGAGVSAAQRAINRFFLDAKRYNEHSEGLPVYLVYRWSDELGNLPVPVFGQLNYYWELYQADVPTWPENLHDGGVVSGNIEEVILSVTGSPYPEGVRQRAGFATGNVTETEDGVYVGSGTAKLQWTGYPAIGVKNQFTFEGWITTPAGWAASGTVTVCHLWISSSAVLLQYDTSAEQFILTKVVNGGSSSGSYSYSFPAEKAHTHLAIVQDASTIRLYLNGEEVISFSASLFSFTDIQEMIVSLGVPAVGTANGIQAAFDGWRIFDQGLTETQVTALYGAELEVKSLGETVGAPTYFWTGAGSPVSWPFESEYMYCVVGGVSGDVEAKAEWALLPQTFSTGAFIGRRASRELLSDPLPYLFNFTGASGANRVDGTYKIVNYGAVSGARLLVATLTNPDLELLEGRYLAVLAGRTAGLAVTSVKAGITFGSELTYAAIVSDGAPMPRNDNVDWALHELGELYIKTRDRARTPPEANIFLEITTGDTAGFEFDFLLFLPYPYAHLKITDPDADSSDLSDNQYIFNHDRHYVWNSFQGFNYTPETNGHPVTLVPKNYNYVYILGTANREAYVALPVVRIELYVTPRFLLPGGLIA